MSGTVLITGASRGIGAAMARRFALAGWRVAVNYNHSKEAAMALCRELERRTEVLPVRGDVGDPAQVEEMLEKVYGHFGFVDALINNAGIAKSGLMQDLTLEQWHRVMDVNLTGCFCCCKGVLPSMIREHRGCILNISSIWGQTGASCEAAYSASKAGMIGLTKALAKEVGPAGVRVNCIAPGVIDTDMNSEYDAATMADLAEETPLCRIGTPAEVAEAALFLCSPEARFITGQVLGVNGGFLI